MSDYSLLKSIHDKLPSDYKEVLKTSFKSYAGYIVEGGKEKDNRAHDLFKLYFVMYYIVLNQKKKIAFELKDLMAKTYSEYFEFANELNNKLEQK